MAGRDYIPNLRLREHRLARRLTLDEVAEELSQLAWRRYGKGIGVNGGMVGKWERGEKHPSRFYRTLLCALYSASEEDLGFRPRVEHVEAAPSRQLADTLDREFGLDDGSGISAGFPDLDRVLATWGGLFGLGPIGQRLLAKILKTWRTEIVKRRTLLKLGGIASVMAPLDLLAASPVAGLANEPLEHVEADGSTADALDGLAGRYQRMYHFTAPSELLIPVLAHLELVGEVVRDARGEALRRRLHRNRSEVAILAGRLSFFDLAEPMAARAFYNLAFEGAREAGDHELSASALGHLSFIPAADHSLRAAQDLLDGAQQHATRGGTWIMPSWLAAVEAEIQAKADVSSASLHALDRAEATLDRVEVGEVPAWMDYYDTTRLNGFKGFAYLRLRRPADAQAALHAALGSLGASATKQRTIFQADLATSYVQQGEIDEGCRLVSQAAVTLAQAGYATSGGRLREFRELVTPWQDRSAVKEFDERLALV